MREEYLQYRKEREQSRDGTHGNTSIYSGVDVIDQSVFSLPKNSNDRNYYDDSPRQLTKSKSLAP